VTRGEDMKRALEILKENGPMLSGKLANLLQLKYGISNVVARKIVSRATSPIHKLKNISFEKNQKYIYLQEQFNSDIFFRNLLSAFRCSSRCYYQVVIAIRNNGGFISKKVLASYVAAPVENLTKHKRYDLIVADLIKLEFIQEYTDEYYQLLFPHVIGTDVKNTKGIELAKKTVVDDFCDWAKKLNIIAYNSAKTFFQCANFAKFQWAFTSPSYIFNISDINTGKPGFWIGDIVLAQKADIEDIQFFLDKIDVIRNFKNLPHFIPVIIADNYTKEAYKLLKKKGVVCAQIGNLFSNRYANTLRELIPIIKNASAIISGNPENFVEYINKIASLEGKMGNLIGDLFEANVGYYFHLIGCKYFELNKIIKYNGVKKEIDVYVVRDGKIKIVECKGIRSTLDHEYVKKWLSDNIPTIYKAIKNKNSNEIVEFELWSTGGYIDETKRLLDEAIKNTHKYSIKYYNASEIKMMAKESRCHVLEKSIDTILAETV